MFDKNGQYLYLLASTDAGPSLDWFSQSTQGLRRTRTIYAIALSKDASNPFTPESDEEKVAAAAVAADTTKKTATTPTPAPRSTAVDLDRIGDRIVAFPIPAAEIEQLAVGEANQVYYLRMADGKGAVRRYDVAKRKDEFVIAEAAGFGLTNDGKKLLYRPDGESLRMTARAEVPALAGEGEQVLVGTVVTADAREPVLEDAAGEELVRDLPDHGAPRAILVREALVVHRLQPLHVIRHQPKQRRRLRTPGLVDAEGRGRRRLVSHARSQTVERQAYGRPARGLSPWCCAAGLF